MSRFRMRAGPRAREQHVAADRLGDAWDDLVAGRRPYAPESDAELLSIVDELHAGDAPTRPTLSFRNHLRETLMHGSAPTGVLSFPTLRPMPTLGRPVEISAPSRRDAQGLPRRLPRSRVRWGAVAAAIAIVLAAAAAGYLGVGGRPPGNEAGEPKIAAPLLQDSSVTTTPAVPTVTRAATPAPRDRMSTLEPAAEIAVEAAAATPEIPTPTAFPPHPPTIVPLAPTEIAIVEPPTVTSVPMPTLMPMIDPPTATVSPPTEAPAPDPTMAPVSRDADVDLCAELGPSGACGGPGLIVAQGYIAGSLYDDAVTDGVTEVEMSSWSINPGQRASFPTWTGEPAGMGMDIVIEGVYAATFSGPAVVARLGPGGTRFEYPVDGDLVELVPGDTVSYAFGTRVEVANPLATQTLVFKSLEFSSLTVARGAAADPAASATIRGNYTMTLDGAGSLPQPLDAYVNRELMLYLTFSQIGSEPPLPLDIEQDIVLGPVDAKLGGEGGGSFTVWAYQLSG